MKCCECGSTDVWVKVEYYDALASPDHYCAHCFGLVLSLAAWTEGSKLSNEARKLMHRWLAKHGCSCGLSSPMHGGRRCARAVMCVSCPMCRKLKGLLENIGKPHGCQMEEFEKPTTGDQQ